MNVNRYPKNGFVIVKSGISISKMAYFVINHSHKRIYQLCDWRETFDEVMDANPTWSMKDDLDCYDDDHEVVESYLKLDYTTNLGVSQLPYYIRDPEFLVWYMDAHDFSLYDISRAINAWHGKPEFERAQNAMDDLITWKKNNEDEDITMLCETMTKSM